MRRLNGWRIVTRPPSRVSRPRRPREAGLLVAQDVCGFEEKSAAGGEDARGASGDQDDERDRIGQQPIRQRRETLIEDAHHSLRRAVVGSTLDARHAGPSEATSAVSARSRPPRTTEVESAGSTWN